MICKLILVAMAANAVLAAPQFVTFKDGNFHVGFGGYHAEAGLGGLLTGNAAHGGLRASAGTPSGQNAAAGLDGILNGLAGGRAYAGAQASDQIGASALIGGSTAGNSGVAGAEAHTIGHSKSVVKTVSAAVPVAESETTVQKVKPPKKYDATNVVTIDESIVVPPPQVATVTKTKTKTVTYGAQPVVPVAVPSTVLLVGHKFKPHHRHRAHLRKHFLVQPQGVFEKRKEIVKTVQRDVSEIPVQAVETSAEVGSGAVAGGAVQVHKNVQLGPGFLDQWFNIPIGILSSIRDNLQPVQGGISVQKQVSVTST